MEHFTKMIKGGGGYNKRVGMENFENCIIGQFSNFQKKPGI